MQSANDDRRRWDLGPTSRDLPTLVAGPRVEQVRAELDNDAAADVLVVTKPANVRWLTGFTGSNGIAVVAADRLVLVTDERYKTQAERQLSDGQVEADIRIGRDLLALVADMFRSATVGVDEAHITWKQQRQLADLTSDGAVAPAGPVVERLRQTKDAAELARLELAAAIADAALDEAMNELRSRFDEPGPSMTERDLAIVIDRAMADMGADGVSFPTIVATGDNSALPHARPSGRSIGHGDLLLIDMGARVDGYGSDMTRTFALGGFSPETDRMYTAVQQAQAAGVAAVANGVEARAVHKVATAVLAEHGLADYFIHGTGHGIGLEIHETPFLSPTAGDTLRTGYVVTVEPGVYKPDSGGVRIEDSVLVTNDGCRPLTKYPKDPVVPI